MNPSNYPMNPHPTPQDGGKQEQTPRTDATLEAMQGGRYSADECHPLYVLAAELEQALMADMRAGAELSKRMDELKADALSSVNSIAGMREALKAADQMEAALKALKRADVGDDPESLIKQAESSLKAYRKARSATPPQENKA